jgi:uncharacterized protein
MMKKNKLHKIATVFIFSSLLLNGCSSSSPKSYYLLKADPAPILSSDDSAATKNTDIQEIIGLGPIEVADYLDRNQLVRASKQSSIIVSDRDYWGEPLTKGIARVLAINLMNKKNDRLVRVFPWRNGTTPELSFTVMIYDLQWKNNEAFINASWRLFNKSTQKTVLEKRFSRTKKCNQDAGSITLTYSDFFTELANEMDNAVEVALDQ